jgi:hypothetical protein
VLLTVWLMVVVQQATKSQDTHAVRTGLFEFHFERGTGPELLGLEFIV